MEPSQHNIYTEHMKSVYGLMPNGPRVGNVVYVCMEEN